MRNSLRTLLELFTKRHYARIVAFAVCGIAIILVALYLARVTAPHAEAPTIEAPAQETVETSEYLAESLPTRIRIPKATVDASFEAPLGIQDNGEIAVPEEFETVGWYKYGPTPGELGPAVILGHVDSYMGPAVFYNLRDLEVGDEILIDREDGSTAVFRVTRLETHAQSGFPTAEVYGDIDHAGLRLITCSGVYDHGIKRYSHNLIVFAEFVEERNAP